MPTDPSPQAATPWLPHHDVAGGALAAATHIGVLLHGIFGSARNLRTFAQSLSGALPGWTWIVADLRNHGDSPGAPPPHDLDACADDVRALCRALGVAPAAVVGHSFGGKVAMQLLADPWPELRTIGVLDTHPHLRWHDEAGTDGVDHVLRVLGQVPQPLARRADVIGPLTAAGIDPAVAQWMTTNLRAASDGYRWKFDLPAVVQMLDSYFSTDSWPRLRAVPAGMAVHVVRAGRSSRWTPETLVDLRALAPAVTLHTLPNAGHWMHVDDPAGLCAVLVAALEGL
ncbi:MAG: alpha/beta fold hydrolase [Deltaproteobacteria bacterium]|nr:alpha/beta fold hydrolase [Deltaproteobacteria bacterium]